jgi:pyruvate/oxaloacetate carboxyltransferase
MKKLGFEDESFRTAPQSLWATRMRTETMLGIAPKVEEAGFTKVCVTSAAAFETAVMYLYEDPWERLRLLRRAMPKTPLNFFIRSRNLMGWKMLPNDVIELFLKCIQRMGIQWVEVFDGLNDLSMIEWHFRVAKKLGLQRTGHISCTESPVHTDEYFAAKARELVRLGVDVVNLSDPCGAMIPERIRSLVIAVKQALNGKAKLGFFAHDCTGVADDCYIEAMQHGVDILKTVSLPLAHGYSLPATIDILSHARRIGRKVRVDEQRIKEIDDYFFWAAYEEKKPIGKRVQFDPVKYKKYVVHQIPGGMMSNLENQLFELKLLHKLPEVLAEAGRVRQELGYPVMVTPYSQLVGVQAVFNVVEGERYRTVPEELKLYVRGAYGKPAAPIDPNALDRILAGGDKEPIDPSENFSEPLVSKVRAEKGSSLSDEDLLLTIFNTRETMEKFYQNKKTIESHPVVRTPLAFLIKELANRHEIKTVNIQKGSFKIDPNFLKQS